VANATHAQVKSAIKYDDNYLPVLSIIAFIQYLTPSCGLNPLVRVKYCDDNDAGDVMKSTGMNFNDHKSKISKRNLYSKWNMHKNNIGKKW